MICSNYRDNNLHENTSFESWLMFVVLWKNVFENCCISTLFRDQNLAICEVI